MPYYISFRCAFSVFCKMTLALFFFFLLLEGSQSCPIIICFMAFLLPFWLSQVSLAPPHPSTISPGMSIERTDQLKPCSSGQTPTRLFYERKWSIRCNMYDYRVSVSKEKKGVSEIC